MMSATKAQSQKIFEKLKTKPANKVRSHLDYLACLPHADLSPRYVLTAAPKTQLGPPFLSGYTCAWIVQPTTETWVSTSPLFDQLL